MSRLPALLAGLLLVGSTFTLTGCAASPCEQAQTDQAGVDKANELVDQAQSPQDQAAALGALQDAEAEQQQAQQECDQQGGQ